MIRIFIILFMLGCSSHDENIVEEHSVDLTDKFNFYVDNFDATQGYPSRCDKITFRGLFSAFGANDTGIYNHQYHPGEWHRDESPCYPDESKSEISQEGMLGVLHHLWTVQDMESIRSLYNYGKDHNWVMGEGRADLVDMSHLQYIISEMLSNKEKIDYSDIANSFRGHVLAEYIWLHGRVHKSIPNLYLLALKELRKNNPESAFYEALHARYTDGDYARASFLLKGFPTDSVPYSVGTFGWQGCTDVIYYILTMSVLRSI